MLHGQVSFDLSEGKQRLVLDRDQAGVVVDYVAERPLKMRQWTGYEPQPDHAYLASIKSPDIPPQWHVEAASAEAADSAFTLTVLRPYKHGRKFPSAVKTERNPSGLAITVGTPEQSEVNIVFDLSGRGEFIRVRSGNREWKVTRSQ
jgi:hypothetical protein